MHGERKNKRRHVQEPSPLFAKVAHSCCCWKGSARRDVSRRRHPLAPTVRILVSLSGQGIIGSGMQFWSIFSGVACMQDGSRRNETLVETCSGMAARLPVGLWSQSMIVRTVVVIGLHCFPRTMGPRWYRLPFRSITFSVIECPLETLSRTGFRGPL